MLGETDAIHSAIRSLSSRCLAIFVTFSTLVLANCVRVPDADDLAKGPQVDEIVRRVKCDLYFAVADPLNKPYGYEWLHSWTVQANLNLIVNDQSQLSPGAVFTQPLNAVTIPGKLTNSPQTFNFGLGAQWNNTATRNETITFTVSFDELTAQFGKHHRNCDFPNDIDLRSELGLREWISAALSPVEAGDLAVGYHKSPKSGAGGATAKEAIKTVSATIKKNESSLPPAPREVYDCDRPETLPKRNSRPPSLAVMRPDMAILSCEMSHIANKDEFDFSKLDSGQVRLIVQIIADIQRVIRDLMFLNTKAGRDVRDALEKTAIELSAFVDPPIDTVSHQVHFIIVLNASATPSWSLVRFKGPGPSSGALFSATATKTHTLNVVIGPPSSPDSAGALNALQIGTAVGNSITTGAPP